MRKSQTHVMGVGRLRPQQTQRLLHHVKPWTQLIYKIKKRKKIETIPHEREISNINIHHLLHDQNRNNKNIDLHEIETQIVRKYKLNEIKQQNTRFTTT